MGIASMWKDLPWPANLLTAVFNANQDSHIPSDIIEAIEFCANTCLNKTECTVLYGRFRERKRLQEVGEDVCLTRERVRQIQERLLQRLRHPSRRRYLLYGLSACKKMDDEEDARKKAELATLKYQLQTDLPTKIGAASAAACLRYLECLKTLDVRYMGLSSRAISVLEHNSTETLDLTRLDNLCMLSFAELHDLRGMGTTTLQAIDATLCEYGIKLSMHRRFEPLGTVK